MKLNDYREQIEIRLFKHNAWIKKTKEWLEATFDINVSMEELMELSDEIKKQRKSIKDMNDNTKEISPYETDDKDYIFPTTNWEVRVPIKLVDELFLHYSDKWINLSQEEIIQKYELKIEVWNLLKSRLRLFKKSHTISPVSLERMSDEELDKVIWEANDLHIKDRYKERFIMTHDKLKEKDYIKKSKILANVDNFLEHLQGYLKNYKPRELSEMERKEPTLRNNDRVTIAFWDLQLWKNNTKDIISRMKKLTQIIIDRPEENVCLIWLWDWVEAIMEGWMHPWQIEKMDWPFWFDLLMLAVDVIEDMLFNIYNHWKEVELHAIGWNHDRSFGNHNVDMDRTISLVIMEIIKRGLCHTDIIINSYKEKTNNFDYGNTRFIVNHWDQGFAKKNMENILWKNWDSSMQNVVLYGDRHHIKIEWETKNGIKIWVPALAWQWVYDKRLDLHSEPWVVIITENEDWTLDILLKRIR